MSTGIIEIIKRAALEAMENAQPTDIRTGLVIETDPLTIQITPQFILPESVLIVPRHLTDYTVKVSFNWETEEAGSHNHSYSGNTENVGGGSGEEALSEHSHTYTGSVSTVNDHTHIIESVEEKKLTIHNKLEKEDKVALLKQKGGQFYYILDRIE
jgi:hypothetical protein